MDDRVTRALAARPQLTGWTVRHVRTRGTQLYAVPAGIEALREVDGEQTAVDVYRATDGADGDATLGNANVTLLAGDDIAAGLARAEAAAALIHNPPFRLPEPATYPDVPLADPVLQRDPAGAITELYGRIARAAGAHPGVQLTAAEAFAEERTTQLKNSQGIHAAQTETRCDLELVLLARAGGQEVESFAELSRRRLADIDVEALVERHARQAVDLLRARVAPDYRGAVVLRDEVLATFVGSDVLRTLGSASAKYSKLSTWELEQPVFRGAVTGDPLTLYATRRLPFGSGANRFDEEGVGAQRVMVVEANVLRAWSAGQRYGTYLGQPVTGAWGDIEIEPGPLPERDLLAGRHVEVAAFSWFNPDWITGDFSSEIRLGYLVDGAQRTPFRGGALVGNLVDALAAVRWSSEVCFAGRYRGPCAARFLDLRVAGD